MNTLKITPINEMLTERHNLENAKVKTFEIKHKEYSFYTSIWDHLAIVIASSALQML